MWTYLLGDTIQPTELGEGFTHWAAVTALGVSATARITMVRSGQHRASSIFAAQWVPMLRGQLMSRFLGTLNKLLGDFIGAVGQLQYPSSQDLLLQEAAFRKMCLPP